MTKKVRSLQRRRARNKVRLLQRDLVKLRNALKRIGEEKRLCCLINAPLCSDCVQKKFELIVRISRIECEFNYAKSRTSL